MNDNLNADLKKMLAEENLDAGPRGVGYYVPGPGGGLIHTYDPDVAQVGREERHDPSGDEKDDDYISQYNPADYGDDPDLF